MRGSGTPTTGRMPLTIPMFTNAYVKNVSVIAPPNKRVNKVGALAVITTPRAMISRKSTSSSELPIKPNSSEKTAKIKSVVRSGMKSRCVWLPWSQPFPNTPPEPSAMVDCMV